MRFLLDTNICIYFIKGMYNLQNKIDNIGLKNCFISEITLAELKYGVEKSHYKTKNASVLEDFMSGVGVIPIFNSLDLYAREKARLERLGSTIDDFDLLIGVTAVTNEMILVTNNETHFSRIDKIKIENWVRS